MVGSASIEYAEVKQGSPWHYQIRHGIYWFMAAGAGVFAALFPPSWFFKHSQKFLVLGVLLLLAVFVPGLGKTVNGSTRWINLVVIQLQASEVAKMCLAFYLAGFLVRFGSEATQTFLGFPAPDCDRSVWRFASARAGLGCLCHHVWHGAVRAVFGR